MIYIIIPVFNRIKHTVACLRCLQNQTQKDFKIFVVDHGSTDGTAEMLRSDFKNVEVIQGSSDLWWTGATNLGVAHVMSISDSNEDLILTLNNDVEVEEGYLAKLLDVYSRNKPCLVGSTSVDILTNKISYAGCSWNKYTAKYTPSVYVNADYDEMQSLKRLKFFETDLLPGRGTLIPIRAFKDFGLFDKDNFPHYAADEDFSLLCRRGGYKLIVSLRGHVKSYVDEKSINKETTKNLFDDLKLKLTSIKSPVNLRTRYRWAKKNTPVPLVYFTFDVCRILGSTLKGYLLKIVK